MMTSDARKRLAERERAEAMLRHPSSHVPVVRDLADLKDRLQRADVGLRKNAEAAVIRDEGAGITGSGNYWRLLGKAEGVRLALSYIEEEMRR